MQNGKYTKCIAVLLIVTLVLHTAAFAISYDENYVLSNVEYTLVEPLYAEYLPAMQIPEETELDDDGTLDEDYILSYVENILELPRMQASELATMFNVHPTPGAAHAGYMFRLVDGAIIPSTDRLSKFFTKS